MRVLDYESEHKTNFLMGPLEEQTNLQSCGCVPQLEMYVCGYN